MTFKPSGSRYYVLTAAWTYDPPGLAGDLNRLRFSLLKQGHDLHRFHATEDKQVNRDAVVSALARHAGWSFAAVVIEKAKVYPDLRPPHRFYPRFAASVLRYVFRRHLQAGTSTVLVFTDTLPINKRREAVEKSIKMACRHELQAETRFESYHHPSASNPWLQVADYCAWAIFRKWEQGDTRTYNLLRHHLAEPEVDALQGGAVRYY